MARRERLGIPTYYASREGVRFDASDQSAAVQAILDRGQLGPIDFVLDGSITAKALKLYTGTTFRGLGFGTKITEATATSFADGYVIGNAHRISPYGGSIVDSNITIRDLYIDGQKRNGVTGVGGGSNGATADGAGVLPVTIWGCNNFRLENVYVYDPGQFGVSLANVFNGVIRNITVIVPGALVALSSADVGTACVQIDGPASDLLIEGLFGATADDFLAMNACDGNMTNTHDMFIWPYFYYGSISRITARGIYPTACPNIVRVLSGTPAVGGGPLATIDKIIVENVVGNTYQNLFAADTIAPNGPPSTGSVTLKDWHVNFLASTGWAAQNTIGGTVRSFTLQGFRLGNRTTGTGAMVTIEAGASVGRLVIDDVQLREDASGVANTNPIVAVTTGTVDELVLSKVNFSRNATTASRVVSVSGGTVNRLELSGVSANNVNNVVAVSGGTVGGLDSTGLVHRGAGGNASLAQSGGTLSRVRAAGSDTALLASGTIGSKKTDATEDS
jgi:hypothetical protein